MNILCCCCSVGCTSSLGLQDHSIPDSALTASSSVGGFHANQARLNNYGGWVPGRQSGAWLQVELENVTKITAIATQGRSFYDNLVGSYSVYHSSDGQHFQPYHQQVGNRRL